MRVAVALAVIAAVGGLVTVAAHANGGGSISAAVPMPLNAHVTSGGIRNRKLNNLPWAADYWSLPLRASERFVVDFGTRNGAEVNVCVLAPSVTDYTEDKAQCLGGAVTREKTQLVFVAPTAGTFTVRFADYPCACADVMAYDFLAKAQTDTRIVLAAGTHTGPIALRRARRSAWRGQGKVAIKIVGTSVRSEGRGRARRWSIWRIVLAVEARLLLRQGDVLRRSITPAEHAHRTNHRDVTGRSAAPHR